MKNLTIELDDQTLMLLHKTASDRRKSLAQVVHAALLAYIQEPTAPVADANADIEMRHAQLRTEAAAWRSLPAAEQQRYGADFVAVLDGIVIDQDADRAKPVQRIRRRFGDAPVLIYTSQC
jgi:hypothetical protein